MWSDMKDEERGIFIIIIILSIPIRLRVRKSERAKTIRLEFKDTQVWHVIPASLERT
jgi:predicted metal-dependent hydrolase